VIILSLIILEVKLLLNRFIFLITISALLLFSINSCSEDPTSIGANLVPHQDRINVNSIDSAFFQKARYYDTDTLALNSSAKVLLGKSDNVESTILMNFIMFLADSVSEAVLNDSLIIKSAVMEMQPIYTYGEESSNSFDFTLHEITSEWNSLSFGKNDLPGLVYNAEDVSTNRQFLGDSLITLDFDKDLVLNWMNFSANEAYTDINGVYFKFTDETNKVVGFPAISPSYDSVLTRLKVIIEVPSQFTDTLVIQVTSDAHVVLGELPTTSNQNIFVQGGIPVRSNIYFDISSIPNNAIINRAILKLSYDESETNLGSSDVGILRVIPLEDYETSEINISYPGLSLFKDTTNTYYSGEITPIVQTWVSDANNGIQLYLIEEVETVNKLAIATENHPNKDFIPYLEIIYTSKN
jgi:hypothetical protein